jgi:hypothetical protein
VCVTGCVKINPKYAKPISFCPEYEPYLTYDEREEEGLDIEVELDIQTCLIYQLRAYEGHPAFNDPEDKP